MDFLKNPSAASEFWRICCERGVAVYEGVHPSQEYKQAWFVQKNSTFIDRKPWNNSHNYPTLESAIQSVIMYLKTGKEPS